MTHALAVVRSHYPTINLQAIGAGFARGMGATEHQQLEDEVEDAAKKLAGDVDLFIEMEGDGKPNDLLREKSIITGDSS